MKENIIIIIVSIVMFLNICDVNLWVVFNLLYLSLMMFFFLFLKDIEL